MASKTGFDYAPKAAHTKKVVQPGEFKFAAAFLDHGHIFGQCNGLIEAGAELASVYDPDPEKVAKFLESHPGTPVAESFEAVLADPDIKLVAAAAIPNERAAIGIRTMEAGKDYFTDKCPFTSLEQLEEVRTKVAETGRRYMVYFSERLHVESAVMATKLIQDGAVGDVVQVMNLAPHRLSKESRPDWFWDKARYGGIITDIGSHQCDQLLVLTGSNDATINFARAANFASPEHPGFEDFGEVSYTMSSGASGYYRLDWFTPDASPVWGDGRTFVVGTKGTLEIRKYWDPLQPNEPRDRIYLVNGEDQQLIECADKVGFPFFGEMIFDLINGTDKAMTQAHIFKSAEISLKAQLMADAARLGG
ncbi:MAG: Gfo/Idh/MocA family protein [Verrucomicrobiia bacterium]|tara:strand:- start:3179 stop:4267 length:1089 start_codon:yes stop_codon:yes gene_type:complete